MTKITAGKHDATRTERILDGSATAKNDGETTLARGLLIARQNGQGIPMLGGLSNTVWERDVADISAAAVRDGYATLHVTDTSTGLMENLHAFARLGWRLGETLEIARPGHEARWGAKPMQAIAIHYQGN